MELTNKKLYALITALIITFALSACANGGDVPVETGGIIFPIETQPPRIREENEKITMENLTPMEKRIFDQHFAYRDLAAKSKTNNDYYIYICYYSQCSEEETKEHMKIAGEYWIECLNLYSGFFAANRLAAHFVTEMHIESIIEIHVLPSIEKICGDNGCPMDEAREHMDRALEFYWDFIAAEKKKPQSRFYSGLGKSFTIYYVNEIHAEVYAQAKCAENGCSEDEAREHLEQALEVFGEKINEVIWGMNEFEKAHYSFTNAIAYIDKAHEN